MEGQAGAAGCGEGFHSWMALNDNKAGMEGLDRDKINKIIMETSKGSKFYENELKKEQQVDQRIERMLQQKAQISEQQLRKAQAQVEKMAADLERGRDLGRVIVHVDMDAFYAAVEMRDCPELKDKPMAVGSKGMLSTSNYHARRFGVRAAMPGFIAKKLCPSLVIVQHNFEKYRAVSAEVREVFADYDPHFLPVSLDEAYLDITEHLRQRQGWPESLRTHPVRTEDAAAAAADGEGAQPESQGDSDADSLSPVLFEDSPTSPPDPPPRGAVVFGTDAEEAVREMRFRIEQRTTLTASAGIAPNMMLAKVCSDKNKPNGQYRIPAERQAVMDFIQDLPIRKVSGIGKVTERMLRALEITTCSELRQKVALLSLLFSEVSWHHFLQISLGLGSTHIERDNERKSMSTERTFGEMSSAEEQYDLCRELCRDLAQDLQKEDLKGKTVTVKLKNVNFEVKTRALTLSSVVSSEEEIFAVAKDLLKTEIDNASPHPLRLRLMGVRVSGFVSCEDRKSLQKSIIGFLQSGRSAGDPPNPPKGAPDEQGVPPNPLHGGASKQAGAPPTVTQESKASPVKWGELPRIPGRPAEEGQQSFFQRAQALRLRREAGRGDPRDPGDSASSSSSSLQPSAPAGPGELFTCPVCFREQEGTDLRSFNRHVDECLSAGYAPRHGTGADGGPGAGAGGTGAGAGRMGAGAGRTGTGAGARVGGEERFLQDEQMHSDAPAAVYETGWGAGSRACQKASEKSRASPAPASDTLPRTSGTYALNGLGPKPVESCRTGRPSHFLFSGEEESNMDAGCSEESLGDRLAGRLSEASGRAGGSGGSGGPPLTCPVCNKKQDTRDLALFNRHVDVCLNQDVLQELGEGPLSHSANVTATAWGKGKPENGHSPTKPSGKNKRHGSPHLPAPKKAKVLVPGNTIDRFFR
ncbi:DNA polymerase kappa [Anguilla anguilla]|uniref:DNA polymerase kappa n=1 Tax=Anguilla anguilla TaxID=7936 RepID=UPI0015B2C6B1|nr:DNA polymerase kappa [Anguilla anguilla]XP_035234346.1 DNA polymerase kappa [Anguilla anguilla]